MSNSWHVEDDINHGLRNLTQKLVSLGLPSGFGLGGEDGYGVYFENDTFGMHPYCWCERDDCAWCLSCSCPDEAYVYFNSLNEIITLDQYYDEFNKNNYYTKIDALLCSLCKKEVTIAPNFWHKKSKSYVYWYKYIGRGMEYKLNTSWSVIIADCLDSLSDKIDNPAVDRSLEINPPIF